MAAQAESWPPRSPLKALLSSPSGRKRYQEYQNTSYVGSSPNKLLGSPSLLEKLRAARANEDHLLFTHNADADEGDEEDEETLQLKIQAIEAKLRLKKLQKQKMKQEDSARPLSSSDITGASSGSVSRLEIPVSPTKQQAPKEWTSPSRIRLGIDKGLTAADVSLKSARAGKDGLTRSRTQQSTRNLERSFRSGGHAAVTSRPVGKVLSAPKSFSERMAETRNTEKDRQERAATVQGARSSRFIIDKAELEVYRNTVDVQPDFTKADTTPSRTQHISSIRKPGPKSDLPVDRQNENHGGKARAIEHPQNLPSLREASPSKTARPGSSDGPNSGTDGGDSSLYEPFSNVHLASRILPHTFLKRTIPTDAYTHLTVPQLLKHVTSPAYSIPDHISDYVVFGIISSKSSPLDHKARRADTNSVSGKDWEKRWDTGDNNKQKFIVFQLTDLTWTVDLYLFGSAVTRYHRLSVGTLIAILNPAVMPPKKGQEDTGKFSLTLHDGEDQVLEIGMAKYLAYCTAKRKDGRTCGDWVNGSKTSICEYHVNAELDKTRSQRMGINSMGRFGANKGENVNTSAKGWDWEAGSYFVVGGRKAANKKQDNRPHSYAPVYNKNLSTAHLLDAANPNDPFIAEGQMLERDKSDRLRRQAAAQQKERDVIKKLGQLGSGGAGGEYMRHRAGTSSKTKSTLDKSDAAMSAMATIMSDQHGQTNQKKRMADSVSLSPIKKKTRFLTDKGIHEAGRESMGPLTGVNANGSGADQTRLQNGRGSSNHDEDDDDDLDII